MKRAAYPYVRSKKSGATSKPDAAGMAKLSAAAANDIEELLDHSIAEFGIQQTENYYDALTRCLELLGENPELCYVADDIRRGYRRFPHETHIIFGSRRKRVGRFL